MMNSAKTEHVFATFFTFDSDVKFAVGFISRSIGCNIYYR